MPAAAQSTFALSRIGQIHVTVEELARAVGFYRDTLGVPFLFEVPGMAFFDCDGVRLMLGVAERSGDPRYSSILYFRVAEVHQAHQTLTGRGVHFEGAPHLVAKLETHDLWMAFFRDSENNLMALMSEVARNDS